MAKYGWESLVESADKISVAPDVNLVANRLNFPIDLSDYSQGDPITGGAYDAYASEVMLPAVRLHLQRSPIDEQLTEQQITNMATFQMQCYLILYQLYTLFWSIAYAAVDSGFTDSAGDLPTKVSTFKRLVRSAAQVPVPLYLLTRIRDELMPIVDTNFDTRPVIFFPNVMRVSTADIEIGISHLKTYSETIGLMRKYQMKMVYIDEQKDFPLAQHTGPLTVAQNLVDPERMAYHLAKSGISVIEAFATKYSRGHLAPESFNSSYYSGSKYLAFIKMPHSWYKTAGFMPVVGAVDAGGSPQSTTTDVCLLTPIPGGSSDGEVSLVYKTMAENSWNVVTAINSDTLYNAMLMRFIAGSEVIAINGAIAPRLWDYLMETVPIANEVVGVQDHIDILRDRIAEGMRGGSL
jgi:hypothetical protein